MPELGDEGSPAAPAWLELGDDDLLPPPLFHDPTRPGHMHSTATGPPHYTTFPSLIVVDDPDARNAFLYGFGPDCTGGTACFSGFLSDIPLKNTL